MNKIIESIPNDFNKIIEIGPGLGDLTGRLLNLGEVLAFEIDEELQDILRQKFKNELETGRLCLKGGDVLQFWESSSLFEHNYSLVANLPYYVATNIILRALRDSNCRDIIVMIQKEVAEKFAAKPKEKEFSALSVLAQSCGKCEILFDVEPSSFEPPPKVTSSVVKIDKYSSLKDEKFESFLKIAFAQPRKKLQKNLSSVFSKTDLSQIFKELELDENLRPHELSTQDYHRLYKTIK